jgi:hypothetical protein
VEAVNVLALAGVLAGTILAGVLVAELVWRRWHPPECRTCSGAGVLLLGEWLVGCPDCDGYGSGAGR